MFHPIENETDAFTDTDNGQYLVLDGTVNLDYADEDQVPRVKGLIEILEQFLGARNS